MKYTLLQMTQDILSSMSSDEVNSISDTVESLQVATIIKQKYFDIINRLDLPTNEQLLQLNPSDNPALPVVMYMPSGVAEIKWLKYFDVNPLDGNAADDFAHDLNTDIVPGSVKGFPKWTTISSTSNAIGLGLKTWTVGTGLSKVSIGDLATATASGNANMSGTVTAYSSLTGSMTINVTSINGVGTFNSWTITQGSAIPAGPGYLYITILPNDEFLDYVNAFNPQDTNIQSYTLSDTSNGFNGNFTFYYRNNIQPTYATVISNFYVLFDSFDGTVDSTLQASKTMACAVVIPTWSMTDTFIPDLAEDQFPLLLNEAKTLAFYELKQQPHPLADKEVKRGWTTIQKKKAIINRPTYFDELPGMGRKRGYYGFRGDYYQGFNDNRRGGLY